MPRRQIDFRGLTAGTGFPVPAVAPTDEARLYYDTATGQLMLSVNGGAYGAVESSGAGGDTLTLGADVSIFRAGANRLATSDYVEITAPAAAQVSLLVTAVAETDAEIEVRGPAANQAAVVSMNSIDGQSIIRWRQNTVTQWQLYQNAADTKLYLRDMVSSGGRMIVTVTPGTAGNALVEFHDKVQLEGPLELVDTNIILGTTTGTQFGTAANQKSSFHGAAAVVQVAGAVQTYATADGTHAAPTAAALTVADGAGTNDGTIGTITDNATTIAAVQELADQINKLVADMADTKQFLNFAVDGLQLKGLFA